MLVLLFCTSFVVDLVVVGFLLVCAVCFVSLLLDGVCRLTGFFLEMEYRLLMYVFCSKIVGLFFCVGGDLNFYILFCSYVDFLYSLSGA